MPESAKAVAPTAQRTARRRLVLRKAGRDTILFAAGLALTTNEAVLRKGTERPTMIMLFAAMMGLPVVLRADEKKKQQQSKGD